MSKFHFLSRFFFIGLFANASVQAADRIFAHPDRIRYDSYCLTIDGHDTFIYSGAFHYFRCPQPLWPERFAKIKAAGFNTVETYIPWDRSEPTAPANPDDFSKIDLKEADEFMTMAESYGLNIIIRPGPYICAEWDRGGLPAWLLTKRPAALPINTPWFRTDDPAYLAWSKHWYDAVWPVIAKHQITRKAPGQPGVILFQIENEYDYSGFPDTMRMKNLAALSDEAVARGIDVPLFTCWSSCVRGATDPSVARAFDSCNFYVSFGVGGTSKDLRKLRDQQPDAPLMVTEQQGGWFTAPKDKQPIQPDSDVYRADLGPSQIQNLELYSIQQGVTLTNYYMLFGGTNLGFGDAATDIATCYDYSAAIRECGGVGEKYDRVKAIGHLLAEHGQRLIRSRSIECDVKTDQPDVMAAERVALDGSRYFFVRTNQHIEPRKGVARVSSQEYSPISIQYDLEPFGSKVLYLPANETDVSRGEWWPKIEQPTTRPAATDLPSAVIIPEVAARADVSPTEWTAVKGKGAVTLGIGDRRLLYYQAAATLSEIDHLALAADVSASDGVSVRVNGSPAGMMRKGQLDLGSSVHAGNNMIELLYDNAGYANFDSAKTPADKMERLGGITGLRIVHNAISADSDHVDHWKMRLLDPATTFAAVPAGFMPDAVNAIPELQSDFNDDNWKSVVASERADQLQPNQVAAFRGTIEVTADELKAGATTLNVSRMDDGGWAYVNGQFVGRGTNWSQAYSFDAAKALKTGRNVIVIVVRNESGEGGVGAVSIAAPQRVVADLSSSLRVGDQSAGIAGDWMHAVSDEGWSKRAIPETENNSDSAVEWRRLSFELPTPKADLWVPWLLRLHASADGILSLNGHPIGRYYHGTPQTDYFLPECWLNFGAGHANIVTMQLHRAEASIAIQSAVVMPYTVYAEKR